MLDHLPQIGLAFAAFALGMFSPGPNILAIIGTSMAVGRRAGIALALGIASGSAIWATMTAFGLTALISAYAGVLTATKVAGGLYLLWLAFKAFRSAASPAPATVTGAMRAADCAACFRRGLTIQMSNPKAALSWIAIMSLGIGNDAPASIAFVLIIGATLLSIAGHLAYALAFSTAQAVHVYRRARRAIDTVLGVFFTFAGLKLLSSRI